MILDFYEDRIEKLGNYDWFEPNDLNNYNLIIETPGYFAYRDKHDPSIIDHKNTEFKEYNPARSTFLETHEIEQAP